MSGMVLTPVSPTPEKSIERQNVTSDNERPAERFDEVSARENARLERKEARQNRADQRAEDNRLADRKAERERLEENRAKSSDAKDVDRNEVGQNEADHQAKADNQASEAEEASNAQAADSTEAAEGKDDVVGDESLPMLFAVPSQPEVNMQSAKGVTPGITTPTGTAPATGMVADKMMMQPLQQGQAGSGNSGDGDALLSAKGEQLSALMGKAAGGDGKALDFSAQLARFQGGGDNANASLQNNATTLQRGLEGRESMAALKSYSTSVDLPVQHAQWGEKVVGKLAWLTAQRMSAAEIHVTPADLGPLEVRVQVQHDQAHVTIHATHSAVRDQLELNGHRLRDMLQENGLNLDKFEVSAESSDQGPQQQLAEEGHSGGSGQQLGADADLEGLDEPLSSGSLDLSWRGEVDLYA